MSDEQTNKQTGQTTPAGDAWQEVGRQFQILGESIAAAFRSSVNNTESQQRMKTVQDSLHDMVNEVDRAIDESMKSPKAQEVRQQTQRAAESLRDASEQTVQEIRPHLLAALKQLNEELQKVVNRMEQK